MKNATASTTVNRMLHYGMVGGSLDAFIGGVHRKAIAINEMACLSAGCFSSHDDRNNETGAHYHLDEDRIYGNYREMAEKETDRPDGIDFVSITTPNNTHYEIAKCFLEHGIHVACEKPLCFTVEQAKELEALAGRNHLLFCVTYTYIGYNMIKLARDLVSQGEIGRIVNVNCEYLQDWRIDAVREAAPETSKMAIWRADPRFSGISNCVGDIGTHIESVVSYVTGLHVERVAAVLDTYGQALDLNANMLVELSGGVHGVFCASQICAGHANGLVIRIFGTRGSLEWHQEEPDRLVLGGKEKTTQILQRGREYAFGRAAVLNRIPSGHPEGLMIAFANIYQPFMNAILKLKSGEMLTADDLDYPDIGYGVRGVRFVTAAVESASKGSAWTRVAS